jgi:hypothetical protein
MGRKLEKLLSNHKAQFISWRICATSGKAINYGLPPDKQLVFGQKMFEYFTDCTLG